MAEIDGQQIGMPIEAEPLDHQRLELPGEKIGEVEGAGSGLGQRGEALLAGEGRIAVWPGKSFDRLRLEHRIERPTRAAIGVGDVDPVMRGPGFSDGVPNGASDPLRPVVQGRRQAAQIEMREAIRLDDGDDLPGERPTSDDQRALHVRHVPN